MFSKDKQQRIRIEKGDSAELEFLVGEVESSSALVFTVSTRVVTNSLVPSRTLVIKHLSLANVEDGTLSVKIEPRDTAALVDGRYIYNLKSFEKPTKIVSKKKGYKSIESDLTENGGWFYFEIGEFQYVTDARTVVTKVGAGIQPTYKIKYEDGLFTFELFEREYIIHQDVYTLIPDTDFIVQ